MNLGDAPITFDTTLAHAEDRVARHSELAVRRENVGRFSLAESHKRAAERWRLIVAALEIAKGQQPNVQVREGDAA